MFGEKINIDGKPYFLGPYLASGLIGVVFPAFAEDDPERKKPAFAVKVPASNLTDNLKGRFWQEFDVLNATSRKWLELHPGELSPFPKTQKVSRGDSEVLAMEFVPDETIISRVLNDEAPLRRERQYVGAALQYARMLQVLHQAGYVCPDRKTDDVRWLEEQKRLVVLDWNVVEPLKSLGVDEKQEYAIFGSLWYQYLTGKVPSGLMSLLDDSAWGGLTLGMREILDGLMHGRYEADKALLDSLEAWGRVLENDLDFLSVRLPDESEVKENVDVWWDRLKLLDLARRHDPDIYEAQYQDFLGKFIKRANRIFFDAQYSLLRSKPEDGLSFLKRIRDGLWQGKDTALKLMWARWDVLMQAALDAKNKGESFFETGKAFQTWFDSITEHTETEKEFWLSKNPKFPSAFIKLESALVSFGLEALIHQGQILLSEISVDDYPQRNKSLQLIDENAKKLREIHQDYHDALLEDVLPDFDALKKTIKHALDSVKDISSAPSILKVCTKPALREYLLRRIRDAFTRDNAWRLAMQKTVDDLAALSDYLAGNRLPEDEQIRPMLVNLFANPEIGILIDKEFRQTLLEAFETLPFAPNERGVLQKFSIAAHILWLGEGTFPVYWDQLEPVCLTWQAQAVQEAERMLATNQAQALNVLEQEWLPLFEQ